MLELDRTRFPLLFATFRGTLTREDADGLLGYLAQLIEQRRRFGLIIASDDVPMPSVGILKSMGEWVRQHRDGMAGQCVGIGMHLESAALRGAVKFINTIAPPPSPQAAFSTMNETRAWVLDRMREEDVEPGLVDEPEL